MKVITVKFFLNMQKKSGGSEKSEVWNGQSLMVPLKLQGGVSDFIMYS